MKKIFIVLVLMFVIYPTISNADVTGGNPAVQRTRVDAAEGILFFDLNNPISQDGVINSWRIYTTPNHSGTGHIKLKIFRDIGNTWQFIGQSNLETVYLWGGVNTFSLGSSISVQAGDIIAWWYPDNTVPSVMYDNTYGQTMNNHDWPSEPMGDVQQDIPDLLANSYWNNTLWGINTRTYSIEVLNDVSVPADDDTVGGNPAVQRTHVDAAEGILFFDLNNPISQDGVINSWRIYTTPNHSGTGHIKLKIFRDIGNTWQFIGQSNLETVYLWGGVNTFSLGSSISVQAGDIIAWWYPDNTVPSVMYNNTYGQTMNNHDWPSEPMGDVQQDIPDLLANSYWNNTLWGINTRTYSIEVLGESSSGI